MNILTILVFIFSTLVFSHDEHDWRTDYQAYLSLSYELPNNTGERKKSFSPRLDMEFFKEKLIFFHPQATENQFKILIVLENF
jgi:hypothetical protein